MKTRERDRMGGWVVWRLLLIGRVGEHRSLSPCLCPYLGVGMCERGSGLPPPLGPWSEEAILQLSASHLLRMALSTHSATRRCCSTCSQQNPTQDGAPVAEQSLATLLSGSAGAQAAKPTG